MTNSSMFLIENAPRNFSLSQKTVGRDGFGTSPVKSCCLESEQGACGQGGQTGQGDVAWGTTGLMAHHTSSSLFVGFLLA